MPRPDLPPTPAASTDIIGQEKPRQVSLEAAFELPPPAVTSADRQSPLSSTSSASSASASSYDPATPTSPTYKALNTSPRLKRTSSGTNKKPKEDFSLPPPPARPRKIIHMKPKSANDQAPPTISTSASPSKPMPAASPSCSTSRRKQPSSTSVAGRKIARKTAHSLIERRRRSKMNEEFGTLKDMIPACDGQEMHKLAILQASIDYVRYLEECVKDLKRANKTMERPADVSRSRRIEQQRPTLSAAPERLQCEPKYHSGTLQRSPIIMEQAGKGRHYSFASSATTTETPAASPVFGPSTSSPKQTSPPIRDASSSTQITPFMAAAGMSSNHSFPSASPSPNILPQPALDGALMDIDRDHEATAALMMLTNDRRGIRPGALDESLPRGAGHKKRATAMSVKELLSA